MVLNETPWMYSAYFTSTFFYPEVKRKWEPIIEKMRLPYQSIDDFMNSQIQTVTFPSANLDMSTQQRGQYEVGYPGGKELEVLINKDLIITFKLTESYISYWIIWDQVDLYLHYKSEETEHKPCWMEPFNLGFFSDAGFLLTEFIFQEITPTSLSELNMSYAAQIANYNTFTWGLHFNKFIVNN